MCAKNFNLKHTSRIGVVTIYALDFLTASYVMICISANGLLGPFEGPVPKNRDFFGPLNCYERSECHFGPIEPIVTTAKKALSSLLILVNANY
jgi:hypothetical protein